MRREDISFPFSFSLSCWWFGSYLYIRSLDDDDEGMIIVLGKTRLILFLVYAICVFCYSYALSSFLACGSGWWC